MTTVWIRLIAILLLSWALFVAVMLAMAEAQTDARQLPEAPCCAHKTALLLSREGR